MVALHLALGEAMMILGDAQVHPVEEEEHSKDEKAMGCPYSALSGTSYRYLQMASILQKIA